MENIGSLAISDEGFVFNPKSGESFTVNQTGLFILRALKEGRSEEEVERLLTLEFDVEAGEAGADVADFVDRLRTCGLWGGKS